MEQDEAITLAKKTASDFNPSYFTTIEDFEPHAWVVAAILAAYGKGFDSGWCEGWDDGVDIKKLCDSESNEARD